MARRPLPGLSIAEAATRKGVHLSTIWAWIAEGLVRATTYGGRGRGSMTRVRWADVAKIRRYERRRPRKARRASA